MHNNNKNTIITGLPRSGTSLFTSLCSEVSNNLYLSEPLWIKHIREASNSRDDVVKNLHHKLIEIRQSIRQGEGVELVVNKKKNGLPENYFSVTQGNEYKREKLARISQMVQLSADVAEQEIYVKANPIFTVCLKEFLASDDFNVIVVLRDPVATLMSWRTLNIPASRGRVKVIEKFSPELRFIGTQEERLQRQVLLLDWYFKQFLQVPKDRLVYYESLVSEPQKHLARLIDVKRPLQKELSSNNENEMYKLTEAEKITAALKKYAQHYTNFYPN